MAAGGGGPNRRLRTVGIPAIPAAGNPTETTTTTILHLGMTQGPTTSTPAATMASRPKETPTPACALSMLSFAVHTDRAVYPVGTPLVITFTVRNATGTACIFDAKAAAGGAWCKPTFAVQDFTLYPWPDGVAVYGAGETPCAAGPTAHLLAPGASFAETTTLDGALATRTQYGSFDQGPGKYGISAAWSAAWAIPWPATDSARTVFEVVPESTTTSTASVPATTTWRTRWSAGADRRADGRAATAQ